jgi:hypothetical protein
MRHAPLAPPQSAAWSVTQPANRPVTQPVTQPANRPDARRVLRAAVLAAGCLAGCVEAPVEWADPSPIRTGQPAPLAFPRWVPVDSALRDDASLAQFLALQDLLREAGAATLLAGWVAELPDAARLPAPTEVPAPVPVPPATDASLGRGDVPADSARCARSLRVAVAPGRGRVAVWWSRRDRGRVALLAAWRDGSDSAFAAVAAGDSMAAPPWRGPIPVDTLDQGPRDAQAADRGAAGCGRPAPGLAVDDRHGYVHVAYALTGPEGPGVFYAHQMDPRGLFEPPQPIVYGTRLGTTRVAAAGDVVAVAYEDPNSGPRTRVALAVSRTAGHLFDDRLTASSVTADARDPHVAVRGGAVAVGWSEIAPARDDTAFVVRRARIR